MLRVSCGAIANGHATTPSWWADALQKPTIRDWTLAVGRDISQDP